MFKVEMKAAKVVLEGIPKDTVLPHLVSHRGFHHRTGTKKYNSRPTENGLPAYESAFQLGFQIAECDITATSDGELLLVHDDNFMRVSKLKRTEVEGVKVKTKTCEFFQNNVVLVDGSVPPTLEEALAVCRKWGRRMVVELKPENFYLAERVLDFFIDRPELLVDVESFISFNRDTISVLAQTMRRELRDEPRLPLFLFLCNFGTLLVPHEETFVVEDIHRLHEVIEEGELDGIIIRHNILGGHKNLKTVAFSEDFKEFLERYKVGIFGVATSGDDNLDYAKRLVSQGFSFVNTDLPQDYLSSKTEGQLKWC